MALCRACPRAAERCAPLLPGAEGVANLIHILHMQTKICVIIKLILNKVRNRGLNTTRRLRRDSSWLLVVVFLVGFESLRHLVTVLLLRLLLLLLPLLVLLALPGFLG